jgi:hypothetical protein
MMLVVVLSGFIGRYLLSYIGSEVHEKQALLVSLRSAYVRISRRTNRADLSARERNDESFESRDCRRGNFLRDFGCSRR